MIEIDEKFSLAIAFVVFIVFIYKFLGHKINLMLNEKSQQIAQDLLTAAKAKEEAEKLLQQAQKYHQQSLQYVEKLQLNTSSELKTIYQNAKIILEQELAKIKEVSQKRLQEEEQVAIRKVQETIISQAIEIVANAKITDFQQQLLIEKALKNLENSNLQT
jgi:F-type H+-transporting ATPase subunit b